MAQYKRGSDTGDRWLSWLNSGRDAGNIEARRRSLAWLRPVYDRVLEAASPRLGESVLEIGAGEGTLGLLALERVGPSGRLVLTDISSSVIAALQETLVDDLSGRVELVACPAETLAGIEDASVDVVLARSVLIYSTDLDAAMASIARVLRPGGRVSAFEPLWLFFDQAKAPNEFFGREMSGCEVEIAAVMAGYREDLKSTLDNPLTAESLVAAAEAAGLGSIRATVEVESRNLPAGDDVAVELALHGRPNPNTCSPAEMAARVLPPRQASRFLDTMEESIRAGRGRVRTAAVYLSAQR